MPAVVYDALTGASISEPPGARRVGATESRAWLAGPAFFDPQINGYAGVDFQRADLTREELEGAVQSLSQAGCAHFLFTLITDAAGALEEKLRRLRGLRDASPMLSHAILGVHLEGPFISGTPGWVGAHPAEHVRDPRWDPFERWQEASGGLVHMLTLAPERPGSMEFIRRASRAGVWVALGHTEADLGCLAAAAQAGAKSITHLGNGCPGTVARHNNAIHLGLAVPELMASLIPDGIHIPPPALGLLAQSLGPARLICTTDAMSAASAPPGHYRIGGIDTLVGEDRVVRNPNGVGLAGSALTPLTGFYNMLRIGGVDAAAAWHAWTRLRRMMYPEVEAPAIMVPFPA